MSNQVVKKCYYCGKKLSRKNFSTDHKRPLSRGGSDKKGNKVFACQKCNCLKGCLLLEEFRAVVAYSKGLLPKIDYKFAGEWRESNDLNAA